jgi:Arc/MetJ family transcription regulator
MATRRFFMEQVYVKKTMYINSNYIKKALKILDVKTEKEAVNKALEIIVEENEIIKAHKEIGGTNSIEQVYK